MTLLEKVKNKKKCDVVREGYSTGVIYAHKTATQRITLDHSLELMRLPQTMIHTGIQQTYQRWKNNKSGI